MIKRKCDFCDKEIECYNSRQMDYLMKQHILSKHKKKVEIKTAQGGTMELIFEEVEESIPELPQTKEEKDLRKKAKEKIKEQKDKDSWGF